QFTFSADAFNDPDGDPLSYSARVTGGGALPAWLSFNSESRTFSGIPPSSGVLSVDVIASDGKGGAVIDTFVLTVTPETPEAVRVNSGGTEYTSLAGDTYAADRYFQGG